MTTNYIYLTSPNQYQNTISTPSYEIYGQSQPISGNNITTLPAITFQEMQNQQNYLNQIQNLVYTTPQSNEAHGNQIFGDITEKYQQSFPKYTTPQQVPIINPQSNSNQSYQNVVQVQNYYQPAQPQYIQYQQKNIQQKPQAPIPKAKVKQKIQPQTPIPKAKVQPIIQPQAPIQQAKVQQIIQPKVSVQGQPSYQENITQNKVPQIDINLQNIQDKPFFVPGFEPNLQLANLILSEPQIPVEIITTQPPEMQGSNEKPQAPSDINQNPQKVKQQINQKIIKPVRNPNTNIKQYEQTTDTHFVNTNEAAKAKPNTIPLKESLNETDRPTVGEGHGLFGSMAVVENFDDYSNGVNEINQKGGNAGNNNLKNINPNEIKNNVNIQTNKIFPGKENLNTQKPIENSNISSIYGNNNTSIPQHSIQNQRTESVTENMAQLPTIHGILQGKKEVLPPPGNKKYI